MRTILISGKSQSGKDTLGCYLRDILTQEHNQRVLVLHFADVLKYYLREYYNWDGRKDEHGRYLLQHLGTDTVRAKYPNYWAETVAKFIAATSADWDYVIIPDARFLNEITVVKKYNPNAVSVRVERYENGEPYRNPAMSEEQNNHPSECDLDDYDFDWYVVNDGDCDDLLGSAVELLEELNA